MSNAKKQTAAEKAVQEILGVDTKKGWLSGITKAVLGVDSKQQAVNQVLFSDKKGESKDAK